MINPFLLAAVIGLAQPAVPPARLPELADLKGVDRTAPAPGAKATVLIFITTDCPIANRMGPEIKRITDEFSPKGATFYFVYVDPTIGREETLRHFDSRNFSGFAVLDARHDWVRALRAAKTPEAMVLDPQGALLYRGRIDNTYEDHNRRRVRATRRDLRDAIAAVLGGRRTPLEETLVVGCDIPKLAR
jgi:hypothetical protein